MDEILSRIVMFQIVIDLIKVTVGAGLCFGALKWRKGLLTTTAVYWGLFLGLMIGMNLGADVEGVLVCALIGLIAMPILTYTIPGVNRFVLGFLVGSKLLFMLTTVLAKAGNMGVEEAIIVPLIVGTVIGLFLMAWTKVRVSAFVLSCSFVGASEIAPVISEWANRILFATTGNYNYLFDPVDLLFSLFKIELTDAWTLIAMILLIVWGGYKQINRLKANNIPLNAPIIGFEVPRWENGKLIVGDQVIDTL